MKKYWFAVMTVLLFFGGAFYIAHYMGGVVGKERVGITSIIENVLFRATTFTVPWLFFLALKTKKPKVFFGNGKKVFRTMMMLVTIGFILFLIPGLLLFVSEFGALGLLIMFDSCWPPLLGTLLLLLPGWFIALKKFKSKTSLQFSLVVAFISAILAVYLILQGCENSWI